MVYSSSLRRFVMLAGIALFLGVLIVRSIQRYAIGNEKFIVAHDEQIDFALLALSEQAGDSDAFEQSSFATAYNFSSMLRLIDVAHYMKNELKGSLHSFLPRRKKIDKKEIATLLEALLRERATLRDYIWDLKGQSRVGIPPRRYRSLMYYLEVLDALVTELRELLPPQ